MIQYTKILRGGWRAELGAFSECAKLKKDAGAAVLAAVATEGSVSYAPTVRTDTEGRAWVLWRAPGAWCYATPTGCTTMLGGTQTWALKIMVNHMDQYTA